VLEHLSPVRKAPSRVVIIGAGGFVGGAIASQLAADKVPMLALTRKELDLLKPEASATLHRLLRAGDSVVFVSALAPTRNNAMLIDNLRMAEAVCTALATQPVAHLVYISSDAIYSDDANPVTELGLSGIPLRCAARRPSSRREREYVSHDAGNQSALEASARQA
jgi:UDP-glucose 4-epimerase